MRAIKNFIFDHRSAIAPVLVIAFCAWYMSRQHRLIADAERGREAAEVALKGQIVSDQETAKGLRADADELLAKNSLLASALKEAKIAAPGAKVVVADRLRTAPAAVADEPREAEGPPPLPPCPGGKYAPDGMGSFYCLDAPKKDQPTKPKPRCVLAAGDLGSFAVDEVVLTTEAGNRLVVGTAEFWRESPGTRSKLAAGKFSSVLSDTNTLAAPRPPRWGAEVTYRCGAEGCGPGAGVLFPPFTLPLLGWRVEGRAGASLGAAAGVEGAAGVRF